MSEVLVNPYKFPVPVVPCDIYALQTPANNDGRDIALTGWHNVGATGSNVGVVTMPLYRTNASSNTAIIPLKIYESSTLISTQDNDTDIKYNELSTDINAKTDVIWTLSTPYTLSANTRLVIDGFLGIRSGIISYGSQTMKTTNSSDGGSNWIDSASWAITGCITSG